MTNYLLMGFLMLFISFSSARKENIAIDGNASATNTEIPLNHGEKWKANKETNESILKMIAITKAEMNAKSFEAEEVKTALLTELESLLKNCTMEGMARVYLKKYLVGFGYRMNAIINHKSTLKEVLEYLETYNTYFE
ncbi:MAG: hypothetical protein COZ75_05745 [Flavobacteriaceae bacterium CG_4_8_14_3_um_filter_34_10]|nr:hypothetical protein [Flavobacteriia bacterium]OIP51425.1 MAG: hypothetical protein AUK33_04480 [Flavobacteriaceae bacterium CG2_30_34_30]PIQ17905.1 MAG: hypothetical protein COW66_09320 [Flavobacteriaceae bacterium CG18_big_fil_WC_8_21_14_2_50_34_36]PIV51817.1 MAG: hypothetical protein COS19_00095 [Flavobacteriaceae bacterium CG02_land_8_20_14_3_00_34_13]PIX09632.1 MAG: hypothetical protein COZ75_05745 [Flavobacteriaceae bacterium CG_4_8_14_3_um_filter_34_10]PIZ08916.1 MAG: hypothetical pr